MTPLQMVLAAGVAAGGLIGSTVGAVTWADARYVAQDQFSDLLWSQLKAQLRELRKTLAADPGNQGAQEDLEDVLDRLCKNYPEDRDCQ